jgi:predicted  nucleic acid-binding Zn-ribbon protein
MDGHFNSQVNRSAHSTRGNYNSLPDRPELRDHPIPNDAHSVEAYISKLEKELQDSQHQLASVKQRKEYYKNKYLDCRGTLQSTRNELQQCRNSYDYCHQELAKVTSKYNSLEIHLMQHKQQETHNQAAIASLQSQKEQMASLIEQRQGEVQAAKEFLDSQDKLSGADIVGKVQAINEQIFQVRYNLRLKRTRPNNRQISAAMSESCKYRKPRLAASDLANETRHILYVLLPTTNHAENAEIVQIALQSRLVQMLIDIGRGWGNCMDPIPRFLDALTRSVQEESNHYFLKSALHPWLM